MKVNKIILFLFVLCLSIFIFSNVSFAETSEEDYQYILDKVTYPYYKVIHVYTGYYEFLHVFGSNDSAFMSTDEKSYIGAIYYDENDPSKGYNIKYKAISGVDYSVMTYRMDGSLLQTVVMNGDKTNDAAFFVSEVYRNDFTIYGWNDKDKDTIFFGRPLALQEIVAEVVAEETPKMAEKTYQQMMTILLCGVGCLALLVALPIFFKVFYKFL